VLTPLSDAELHALRHRRLPRSFYGRDTVEVARELVGQLLVHELAEGARAVQVVETEAYLGPHDLASHSRFGPTPRARIMFGPPGFAYVYLIYGMHHCLNVVTESDGQAGAVLLRAASPWPPPPAAERERGARPKPPSLRPFTGPGKLCAGLAVSRRENGADLTSGALYLAAAESADVTGLGPIVASPRIGVAYAGTWAARLLRFYARDSPYVSGPRSTRGRLRR